jgi:hypothetical protein
VDDAWLGLVRTAEAVGDMSSLFPPGIHSLLDLPYTVHHAILAALNYLSFNELPKDERPPKWMWLDGDKLDEWFKEVERLREAKYNGGGDQSRMESSNLRERLIVGE